MRVKRALDLVLRLDTKRAKEVLIGYFVVSRSNSSWDGHILLNCNETDNPLRPLGHLSRVIDSTRPTSLPKQVQSLSNYTNYVNNHQPKYAAGARFNRKLARKLKVLVQN